MTTLTMTRGDDRVIRVAASASLETYDLTFTAKRHRWDTEPVILKTSADGITLDGTTVALVAIDAADTEDLDAVALFWDVEATDPLVGTIASGRLVIDADVTD